MLPLAGAGLPGLRAGEGSLYANSADCQLPEDSTSAILSALGERFPPLPPATLHLPSASPPLLASRPSRLPASLPMETYKILFDSLYPRQCLIRFDNSPDSNVLSVSKRLIPGPDTGEKGREGGRKQPRLSYTTSFFRKRYICAHARAPSQCSPQRSDRLGVLNGDGPDQSKQASNLRVVRIRASSVSLD